MKATTIALVGDVLLTHRLAPYPEKGEIKDVLHQHDCCIGNLEMVVRQDEGWPEAFPGGSHCYCQPACLDDLMELGLDMFSTANNHAMDFGHGGLLSTIKYLDQRRVPHAGTGCNLAEASRAAHYETSQRRFALISVTSSFHDSYLAGPQNQEFRGRPGVSPLRHKALYSVPPEDYAHLSRIANLTGINSYHDQAIREGYLNAAPNLRFGSFEFTKHMGGVNYLVKTSPLEADMRRTSDLIEDAKLESDIVLVSVHSHQFRGQKPYAPEFVELFCRECVRSGADVVFCHGPHILRGVEAVEGGLIFYGLGNFILQHEGMDAVPEEAYAKQGASRADMKGTQHLFLKRSNGGRKGLVASSEVWESMMVSLSINDQNVEAQLIPIRLYLNEGTKGHRGLPYITKDESILQRVAELSEPYGTRIEISDAIGHVNVQRK